MLYKCDTPVLDAERWDGNNFDQLVVFLTKYGASNFRRASDGIFFFDLEGSMDGNGYALDIGEWIMFDPAGSTKEPLWLDHRTFRDMYSPQ